MRERKVENKAENSKRGIRNISPISISEGVLYLVPPLTIYFYAAHLTPVTPCDVERRGYLVYPVPTPPDRAPSSMNPQTVNA
jgi:hypothetical protein